MSVSFEAVNQAVRQHLNYFLEIFLPGGRYAGKGYLVRNPVRLEKNPSLLVARDVAYWKDLASGDSGSDPISLYAYLNNISQLEAARALGEWVDVQTFPSNASPVNGKRQKVYIDPCSEPIWLQKNIWLIASDHWVYHDNQGIEIFIVCRFDLPNGEKEFRQFVPNGRGWIKKSPQAPIPLYNLHEIVQHPHQPIVFLEGEKAAKAAKNIFPTYPCTTTLYGAKSPLMSDFSPLKDRTLLIWPDHDTVGQEYANTIAQLAIKAGAVDVKLLIVSGDKPRKWDAFDAVREGITREMVDAWGHKVIKSDSHVGEPGHKSKQAEDTQVSSSANYFAMRANGLWHQDQRLTDTPFKIEAKVHSSDEVGYAYLIAFKNKKLLLPLKTISYRKEAFCELLCDHGLQVSPNTQNRKLLAEYFFDQKVKECSITCKIGWHGQQYVLPIHSFGEGNMCYDPMQHHHDFGCKGTVIEWRDNVAKYANGNSRLCFAVSIAFASVLLTPCQLEGGGIHLVGDSSTGKTTIARVAASVFGPRSYTKSWRSTGNSIEAIAENRNDALLIIDEFAEVSPHEADMIAYTLGNGQGKNRLNKDAYLRETRTFRVLFFSTGEVDLEERMSSVSKQVRAGQEVRMLNLPIDTGKHKGFEQVAEFGSGYEFSRYLLNVIAKYHGTAIVAFLAALTDHYPNHDVLRADFKAHMDTFTDLVLKGKGEVDSQVRRAINRFAIASFAGTLATWWGLTGWDEGEAMVAACECFEAWVEYRGGVNNSEDARILNQVQHFFATQSDRFEGYTDYPPRNRAGYYEHTGQKKVLSPSEINAQSSVAAVKETGKEDGDEIFYVFPSVFEQEICKGYSRKRVTDVLLTADILVKEQSGKHIAIRKRLGSSNIRVYKFVNPLEI